MDKLPEVSYPNHPIDNEERVKTIKEIINDIELLTRIILFVICS